MLPMPRLHPRRGSELTWAALRPQPRPPIFAAAPDPLVMLGMVLPRLRMERGCFDFSKLGRPASPCRLAHLSPPVAQSKPYFLSGDVR